MKRAISLKEAIKFHGHLGPYLVLGVMAGESALKKLRCGKYFDLKVSVWGADKRPKSCLIDGLQLSTGATYGKGNISKFKGKHIKMLFSLSGSGRTIALALSGELSAKLEELNGHRESEQFARRLWNGNIKNIFTET